MRPPGENALREIVLFEDDGAAGFGPLGLVRPIFELIAGAFTLGERATRVSGLPVRSAWVRPHLSPLLSELGLVPWDAAGGVDRGSGVPLALNAACLLDPPGWEEIASQPPGMILTTSAGRVVAARLDTIPLQSVTGDPQSIASTLSPASIRVAKAARVLRHSSELISAHEAHLDADIRALMRALSLRPVVTSASEGVFVRGPEVFAEDRVRIQGPVAIDATAGPVLLRREVRLAPFTFLEGPVLVGEGTQVLGGRIAQSYLGPGCLIRGEVAGSVFLGWSNKAHDGFVGHSYFGAWVNLGAMTTTSNLKNTYGEVRIRVDDALESSGRTKLGSVIGDHSKTAIGTLLATGATIGVGVNLFGAVGIAPRFVPSFVWGVGPGASEHDPARCLRTAERVMARRGRELSAAQREVLRGAFVASAAERRSFLESLRT